VFAWELVYSPADLVYRELNEALNFIDWKGYLCYVSACYDLKLLDTLDADWETELALLKLLLTYAWDEDEDDCCWVDDGVGCEAVLVGCCGEDRRDVDTL